MGGRKFAAGLVATALVFSSSAATATSVSQSPQVQGAQSGWVTLSMLTPSGALGLEGTASQASQGNNPPPPPAVYGGTTAPPIPVIGIWLGTLAMAIYILSRNHRGGTFLFPRPVSAT